MNIKGRKGWIRHRVWHCVKNRGITNPLTISREESLKLSMVKQVLKDLENEGLLSIVQKENRIYL